jgi:ubiquitin related modifier 1
MHLLLHVIAHAPLYRMLTSTFFPRHCFSFPLHFASIPLWELEWGDSGGLESLFNNRKRLSVDVPAEVASLGDLIQWIRETLIRERHDMFSQGNQIRPGVLVLVNDVDWELENKQEYQIQDSDSIAFISTLHGG